MGHQRRDTLWFRQPSVPAVIHREQPSPAPLEEATSTTKEKQIRTQTPTLSSPQTLWLVMFHALYSYSYIRTPNIPLFCSSIFIKKKLTKYTVTKDNLHFSSFYFFAVSPFTKVRKFDLKEVHCGKGTSDLSKAMCCRKAGKNLLFPNNTGDFRENHQDSK